ncbi:MAG: biopolymer transporter Tol, partial [Ignavibacteriales bacterium]|nr:biopolymer transporter Tol [Ignavibacteriales bacterium]
LSASLPIDRFYRFDASISSLFVAAENLDDYTIPNDNSTFIIPSISFVHDNVMWGYTSPIQGTRYKMTVFGNPGIDKSRRAFVSVLWDYRKYFRFFYDNSFAIRLSGGYSMGGNPQRFFLGGTDSWINYRFASGYIPLEDASDFAFMTPALPLRGYDYAQQIGTKYSLLNLEFRLPVVRYLLTGPLPLLFQNILGTIFLDVGTAWEKNEELKLFRKTGAGNLITNDLLIGTGYGFRMYLLFFLLRFDVAWSYDFIRTSAPKYYFSIGADF